MIYRDFQDLKLSGLGMGAMRLPVIDGDDSKIDAGAVQEMVDYAMEHGCRYLRMDTGEVNQTARRMYKKLGYWEADIIPCDFNSIPDWKMVCLEKRLNCYKKSGKSY